MKNKLSFVAALALAVPVLAGTNIVDMSSFQDPKERTRALDKSLLQLERLAVHAQTNSVASQAKLAVGITTNVQYLRFDGTTGTLNIASGVITNSQ